MLSKYTITNDLGNGYNISSISLMKVAGEFVNPKGMTNHSKRPSLAFKVVFHTSKGSMGLVIPRIQVDLVEIFRPFELV